MDIDLDHVAVAVEHHTDVWPRYAVELAGAWVSGGDALGFAAAQLRFANGMKLEVLEPANIHLNDFLRRFLDRNGPGPHHLTYKVRDIHAAIAAAIEAGYRPVNAQLDDPMWKEVFLHPKDAPGVVVQLAQSGGDWQSPPPPNLPKAALETAPATLAHVAHAVADMGEGLRLFEGLLHGKRVAEDDNWIELGWKGPGRVRLVELGPADARLNGNAGRVLYLAFAVPGLEAEAIVEPEDNFGTRLRMFPG